MVDNRKYRASFAEHAKTKQVDLDEGENPFMGLLCFAALQKDYD
jgi:hypothetical protein